MSANVTRFQSIHDFKWKRVFVKIVRKKKDKKIGGGGQQRKIQIKFSESIKKQENDAKLFFVVLQKKKKQHLRMSLGEQVYKNAENFFF